MYFVTVCFLMVISINASAALINCREMNKKVTIKECNAFKNDKRDKERAAKLEERKQKDAERAAKREQDRAVQMEERKKRDAEREEQRAKQREEQQAKEAQELEQRKLRDTEKAAKKEQERLVREEAQKKRDEAKIAEQTNSQEVKKDTNAAPQITPVSTISSGPRGVTKEIVGNYSGECVQFARERSPRLPTGLFTWQDKKNIINSRKPSADSVAVIGFNTGNYVDIGHVAVVESFNNNSITILEANYTVGKISRRTAIGSSLSDAENQLGIVGYFR